MLKLNEEFQGPCKTLSEKSYVDFHILSKHSSTCHSCGSKVERSDNQGTVVQKAFVVDFDCVNVISRYYYGIDQTFHFSGSVNEQMVFHGKGTRVMQSRLVVLQGQLTLANGSNDEYSGDWIDGLRDGHGTQTYLNGDVYTGCW
jgi:hypothetical protein